MSTEANKEISRRWNEEFFNQRQVDAIDRYLHPNYIQHPSNMDLAAAREFFTNGLESTPNLHLQIEDLIAEGDKVVTRWTMHGWQGKTWGGISIYRIEDGKIAEDWAYAAEIPEA